MKPNQVSTPNMACVLYLLERRHTITDVGIQATWPYGIEELCVTLEGENIDLDYGSFLRHRTALDLTRLPRVFEAVTAVVWRKAEGGEL